MDPSNPSERDCDRPSESPTLTAIELESRLLAQEHRTIPVIANYLSRNKFSENDPRRASCVSAALYTAVSAFFPFSSSGGGGGLLALIGCIASVAVVIVSCQANRKLESQNRLILEQNRFLEAARVSENVSALIAQLFADIDTTLGPATANEKFRELPQALASRTSVLSTLCQPYDVSPGDNIELRLSPERRNLLLNLVARRIDISKIPKADFSYADLRGADLSNSSLRGVNLRNADFTDAYLYGANLAETDLWSVVMRNADLANANLAGAAIIGGDLSDATLVGSNFSNADLTDVSLSGARMNSHTKLTASTIGKSLDGLFVNDKKWLEVVKNSPPNDFSFDSWKLVTRDDVANDPYKFRVQLR